MEPAIVGLVIALVVLLVAAFAVALVLTGQASIAASRQGWSITMQGLLLGGVFMTSLVVFAWAVSS